MDVLVAKAMSMAAYPTGVEQILGPIRFSYY